MILLKLLRNLDSNKAHGHCNISIRMLKICGDIISKPLELIFKQTFITGSYSFDWRKGNIVPVHNKGNKQNIKNYHPVSLLPICGKVCKRILFNNMFSLFHRKNLTTQKQSRFKPGDSGINQLLSMTIKFTNLLMMDLKLEAFFRYI